MLPSLTGLIMVTAAFAHLSPASASHSYDEKEKGETAFVVCFGSNASVYLRLYCDLGLKRGFLFDRKNDLLLKISKESVDLIF